MYTPKKKVPPSRVGGGTFFGTSRDLIQQLGEGIQLPLCSFTNKVDWNKICDGLQRASEYIPLKKSIPPQELDVQLFFGNSRDLVQKLGEGIQLPLCTST